MAAEAAIAGFLHLPQRAVWVTPHPQLTRMAPLWAGKRRWVQTRQQYKKIINAGRDREAAVATAAIHKKLEKQNMAVATALKMLAWRTIHHMERVTAYQTQNVVKLKLNRLRLWNNEAKGYNCLAEGCQHVQDQGTVHLVWGCVETRTIWTAVITKWGLARDMYGNDKEEGAVIEEVFRFKLERTPTWIVQWGTSNALTDWDEVYRFANELWQLTGAVVLTAIWRRHVDRLHRKERRIQTLGEAVESVLAQVREAYRRFRGGLYPVTQRTVNGMLITELMIQRWTTRQAVKSVRQATSIVRVGFFDGGSRGNPGPGGSGSVIVEVDPDVGTGTVLWAAATALGAPATTNNIAEFTGLHCMLQYAAARQWNGLHVVGDSQLILRMMKTRKPPRSAKLTHWYRQSRKWADQLEVSSWTHHYRAKNKTADWLANCAMDNKRSTMAAFEDGMQGHALYKGLLRFLTGDLEQWTNVQGKKKAEVPEATDAEAGHTVEGETE